MTEPISSTFKNLFQKLLKKNTHSLLYNYAESQKRKPEAEPVELDAEPRMPPRNHDSQNSNDQVIGHLIFQTFVAVKLARSGIESHDILSESNYYVENYDYAADVENLQGSHFFSTEMAGVEDQKALFERLGATYRTRSESEANSLLRNIINPFNSIQTSNCCATPDLIEESKSSCVQTPVPPDELENDARLPRYTSALFELGQKYDMVPERTHIMLSYYPQKWKFTIRFGDIEGSGIARSKKTAGHLAARDSDYDACDGAQKSRVAINHSLHTEPYPYPNREAAAVWRRPARAPTDIGAGYEIAGGPPWAVQPLRWPRPRISWILDHWPDPGYQHIWALYKPQEYFNPSMEWHRTKTADIVMINLMHDLDILQYFFGPIIRVHAEKMASQRYYKATEGVALTLHFQSGVIGTFLSTNAVLSPYSFKASTGENPIIPKHGKDFYRIFGSETTLSVPDMTRWSYNSQEAKSWKIPLQKDKLHIVEATPFDLQVQHFVKDIRGQVKPICPGNAGLQALSFYDTIEKALETGETVNI
ncbi:hypothetical protein BDW59DRAFT_157860 [Aspergillus cavernicola]|uniref:Gfo/Idh/MocA-like oxidoreductase C-terminal domain-containing protein n=1 Tax=Aspergillus cavernicola TaxID=176166 RepID=A0ABR4IUT9_9EURO